MGAMALFWSEHVYSYASGNFFEAAQEVCERETPEIVKPDDYKGLLEPHEVPDRAGEIEASGSVGGDRDQSCLPVSVGRPIRPGHYGEVSAPSPR